MSEKDRLVMQLANAIVSDDDIRSSNWDAVSVVIRIHEGGSGGVTGVRFRGENSEPEAPHPWNVMPPAEALREEMRRVDGHEWIKCLVQITRSDGKVHIDFEYDDWERWKLKVKSLDTRDYQMSLRPSWYDPTVHGSDAD